MTTIGSPAAQKPLEILPEHLVAFLAASLDPEPGFGLSDDERRCTVYSPNIAKRFPPGGR